jgi:hypothetical protein
MNFDSNKSEREDMDDDRVGMPMDFRMCAEPQGTKRKRTWKSLNTDMFKTRQHVPPGYKIIN